ncbi:LysR substrate-binding domain-containing protein [Burkholderia sp. HI4860]|uniref:LysR substrate-binding domain-containing protein n=1 Tax=Burkholderia sp. HI4860 TaxID=2015361 RepID=UPI002416D670|nr:LysR substrate-binding domain-containing protein [Burkholderia sp. HI4860]
MLFRSQRDVLRLKAPSTLTMRWLLDALAAFRATRPAFEVQIASVWMDVDTVDFFSESYDCAILLGAGKFGEATQCVKLFDEWLIPVCSRATATVARTNPAACELIHPSPDRRDWRRWLKGSGHDLDVDITRGQVFDMLEQGIAAAIAGHASRSAISRCVRRPSTRSSSCCRSRPPSIRGTRTTSSGRKTRQGHAGARPTRVPGVPDAAPDVPGIRFNGPGQGP